MNNNFFSEYELNVLKESIENWEKYKIREIKDLIDEKEKIEHIKNIISNSELSGIGVTFLNKMKNDGIDFDESGMKDLTNQILDGKLEHINHQLKSEKSLLFYKKITLNIMEKLEILNKLIEQHFTVEQIKKEIDILTNGK